MKLISIKSFKIILSFFIVIFIMPFSSSLTDSDLTNNVKNVTINVIESNSLVIDFVAIDEKSGNFSINMNKSREFLNSTYPLADNGLKIRINDDVLSSNVGSVLESEEEEDLLLKIFRNGRVSRKVNRVVGIVPNGWFVSHGDNQTKGFGSITYTNKTLWNSIYKAVIVEEGHRHAVAHEIGHTFRLCDEYSSIEWLNSTLPDLGFPCPNGDNDGNGALDASCLDTPRGCDTSTFGKLVPWNNSNDNIALVNFMGLASEENQRWIDNLSYSHLLNELSKQPSFLNVIKAKLFTGKIYKNGTIVIDPIYILDEQTIDNESSTGNYSIVLKINETIFFNKSFEPVFKIMKIGGNVSDKNVSIFSFVIPFSPSLTQINIIHNNTIKSQINRTQNSPYLNLTYPVGGELISNKINITYNASDIDNDNINYAILISNDNGNNFTTLEIDYSNKSFSMNTSILPESKQYKVKVLATDGINTNTTISQNVFEIDNDLRIINLSTIHENRTRKVFFYKNRNTLDDRLNNIVESFNTGESSIQFAANHSLNSSEEIMVFIEYNYTTSGEKILTATSTSGSLVETESSAITVPPNIEVLNIVVLDSNLTKRVFRFEIKNNAEASLTNINWTFDTNNSNVINSTVTTTLQPDKELFVYLAYNFTASGTFNVNATARNSTLIDSRNLTITI